MLSISAQKTITGILAQLEHREQVLQGVESTTIEKELVYRRGEFVMEDSEKLSSVADEMYARAERRKARLLSHLDALRGVSAVTDTHEEQRSPAKSERTAFSDDPYKVLTSSEYSLEELPSIEQNVIRIQATPAVVEKPDFASFPEGNCAFTITMRSMPAQLLSMEMTLVNMPWWFRWLLESMKAETTFQYVRGVPVPGTRSLRLLSRGIGQWRLGIGRETEIRYKG